MKSFCSLTQQIELWRRKYQTFCHLLFKYGIADRFKLAPRGKNQKTTPQWNRNKRYQRQNLLLLLAIAIFALTSVIGYRFYNQPQLAVGTISPVTITAPRDGQFEDSKTTAEKRRDVQTGVIPILKQNREITAQIKLQLTKYLSQLEFLRQLAEPFPFIDTKLISIETQQYLRSSPESEIKQIFDLVKGNRQVNLYSSKHELTSPGAVNVDLFQQTASELNAYRQQANESEFESLLARIALSRYRYSQAWKKLQQKPGIRLYDEEIITLLDLDEPIWETTQKTVLRASERILTQGIPPGMPSTLLEEAITVQLSPEVPSPAIHLASHLLLEVLYPNLEEDREATRNMAEKAALAIEPAIVEIDRGEVIVEEGQVITQADFVLLDGFGLSRRSVNWNGLLLSGIMVTAAVSLFLSVQKKEYPFLRRRDYLLLCLLSLSAPILAIFQFSYINLSAIGLLVSSFYSPALAICQVGLLTGLVAFSTKAIGWEYLLAGCAGGIMAATIAGRLRSREAMARLGVMVGLTQGGVYLFVNLILSASAVTIWSVILPRVLTNGLFGLGWSVVALGISPYLERIFDVITPIRLAELSNPNLPLLKKLATEAPGTFQHTMSVASLAEAAARELNCNVELIRAGTLYHDIGKLHDPLGFIENQMGGANKHDEIDDPWESAEFIKKHVSEGLVMARKYGLPKAIRDFIPEHQGTLLIAYFYHQAKQKAEQETGITVLESDFRYDGPIPQSREAGIMMLADGCEAAMRSLKEATPEQALTMIRKIFKARWQDGQLVDSGLNYEDLPIIANVFVRVWQQLNHKRIAYPKAVFEPKAAQQSIKRNEE
ncbi:HD family phosphohydrolase [Pleurocapsales cyanobacterium LEGE 06147]|nr:HD family phosphohydrolase [Pleurocapsales cyanobacterium LEGE 06147]